MAVRSRALPSRQLAWWGEHAARCRPADAAGVLPAKGLAKPGHAITRRTWAMTVQRRADLGDHQVGVHLLRGHPRGDRSLEIRLLVCRRHAHRRRLREADESGNVAGAAPATRGGAAPGTAASCSPKARQRRQSSRARRHVINERLILAPWPSPCSGLPARGPPSSSAAFLSRGAAHPRPLRSPPESDAVRAETGLVCCTSPSIRTRLLLANVNSPATVCHPRAVGSPPALSSR